MMKHLKVVPGLFLVAVAVGYSLTAQRSKLRAEECALNTNLPSDQVADLMRDLPFLEAKSRHEVQLLEHGSAALVKRLQMIESAKSSIKMDYYIFGCDDSGRILLDALIQKTKREHARGNRNFKTQILLDNLAWDGAPGISPYLADVLKESGIETKYYNVAPKINLIKLNHRNHRKLFITDDQQAIVGGRNLADDYFDMHEGYNFLDRDIWVEGQVSKYMSMSFDSFWNSSISEDPFIEPAPTKPVPLIEAERDRSKRDNLEQARWKQMSKMHAKITQEHDTKVAKAKEDSRSCTKTSKELLAIKQRVMRVGTQQLAESPVVRADDVVFVTDLQGLGGSKRKVTPFFQSFIDGARSEIFLENYTYLPDKKTREVMEDVTGRGVKVRVLTNGYQNKPDINLYALSHPRQVDLVRQRGEVIGFNGQSLKNVELVKPGLESASWSIHTKAAIRDHKDVWVGTNNLDPRSENINVETGLLVRNNPEFAAQVQKAMEDRMTKASRMRADGEFEGAPKLYSNYTPEELAKMQKTRQLRFILERLY